jgi:hypothetical protein
MASPSTKVFVPSAHVHVFSLADPADFMDCTVTSYDTGTGALVTDCFAVGGSGTNTDWVIISAGARGAVGPQGVQGIQGDPGANGAVAVNGTPTLDQMTAWHNATTIKAATPGTHYLDKDTTSLLSKGFTATSFSAGTKSSGTYTPAASDGGFQHAVNGGAHTLAPPTASCSIVVEYLNNGSAGAITTSGFTKVYGAFDTTNTNKFLCNIIKTNSYSLLQITPLQ